MVFYGVLSNHEPLGDTAVILTLNMLNRFKDYKRFIHILICIFDLAWP